MMRIVVRLRRIRLVLRFLFTSLVFTFFGKRKVRLTLLIGIVVVRWNGRVVTWCGCRWWNDGLGYVVFAWFCSDGR